MSKQARTDARWRKRAHALARICLFAPRVANGAVGDFRILGGLRKGSHGAGQWALPGGWLEKGEEFLDCALRELREETGIAPSDSDLPTRGESKARAAGTLPFVANNTQMDGVHSVTVFCYVKLKDARTEARVAEPDKCEEWRWCSREELAELPLFWPADTPGRSMAELSPAEKNAISASQRGHASTGALRISDSPKKMISNSRTPPAKNFSILLRISIIGPLRAFFSIAHTPTTIGRSSSATCSRLKVRKLIAGGVASA